MNQISAVFIQMIEPTLFMYHYRETDISLQYIFDERRSHADEWRKNGVNRGFQSIFLFLSN